MQRARCLAPCSHGLQLLTAGSSADKLEGVSLIRRHKTRLMILLIFFMYQAHSYLPLSDEVSAASHPWDYQKRCFSFLASRKDISTSQMLFVYLAVPVSDHKLTKLQFPEKQLSKATNPILPRPPHPGCSLTETPHCFACMLTPKYRRHGQRSSS